MTETYRKTPLQLSHGCVVMSMSPDLLGDGLSRMRRDLLELVASSGARGAVLDFSAIEVLDATEFAEVRGTISVVGMMGAKCVVSSLQPGVVGTLVDLGVDISDLVGARDLDDAFVRVGAAARDSVNGEPD